MQMLKLHVDACLADFEMRLAGASQPMVAATRARLSGAAAVARQATLPPQTTEVHCRCPRLLEGAGGWLPCMVRSSLPSSELPSHVTVRCCCCPLVQRRLPVGAHRSVSIPVTIKGCR